MDQDYVEELERRIAADTSTVIAELTGDWEALVDQVAAAAERDDDSDLAEAVNELPDDLLVLKYMHPAGLERALPPHLWVAPHSSKGTWGWATYVTPVTEPFSSAFYGRAGVVAPLKLPDATRVLDARHIGGRRLFLRYAQAHPMYEHMMVTVNSHVVATYIRNDFRRRFSLDMVVFGPDEFARPYTQHDDVWMAVYPPPGAPRTPAGTARVNSRFGHPAHTVIIEEEFAREPDRSLHEPLFALRTTFNKRPEAAAIVRAYARARVTRIQA